MTRFALETRPTDSTSKTPPDSPLWTVSTLDVRRQAAPGLDLGLKSGHPQPDVYSRAGSARDGEFNPPVEAGSEGLGVMEGALEFPIVAVDSPCCRSCMPG